MCSHTGWLEVMGCGSGASERAPHVEDRPETYSGFAFGFGADRLAMLLFEVDDLRLFFENDLRFCGSSAECQQAPKAPSLTIP